MFTRRNFLVASVAAGALLATGQAMAAGKGLIGISMPTKSSTRWISDGESMVKEFTAMGYEARICSMPKMTFQTSLPRSKTWSPRVPRF